jgi:hypothetical protein
MTVQTEVSRSGPYDGAGTTGPFLVDFRFLASSHLRVIRTETGGINTELALTTDYTVTGAGGESGTVTLVSPLLVGEKLTILRNPPYTQEADYVNNDAFPAETHEQALDLLTMQTQQLKEAQSRALTLPPTVVDVSTELPTPESNKLIGWNEAGDGLQNVNVADIATVIAFGNSEADKFSGDGVTTDFTLSSTPGSLNNLDISIGGLDQRPSVDYNWTAGTTLSFTAAPPAGTDNILVKYKRALLQGTSDAASAAYSPGGAGAIDTNVEAKLRERMSAFDHMTVAQIADVQAQSALVDVTSALQAAIDAADNAGMELFLPAGTYSITGVKVYPYSRLVFDPKAVLKMSADGFGIRTLSAQGGSLPTGNIRRVQLISPRVDMNSKNGIGILIESCTTPTVTDAYITNIGTGTFNYDDGDGSGSVSYSTIGLALKGISGVQGCYYADIRNPRTSGGAVGIWLGTSPTRTSKANDNIITNPVCMSATTGILLYTADDNLIVKPEVSTCTTGIRVGVPGGGVYYCNRNRFVNVYLESATTGMNITTESSSTVVDGVASIISTTTPFVDNGFATALFYPKRLALEEYARFYEREIRGVAGVKFLATQEASADANTLDDYEEGQFSPVVEGSTTAGTVNYLNRSGRYTKIGDVAFFEFRTNYNTGTGTGNLQINLNDIPFTPNSNYNRACEIRAANLTFTGQLIATVVAGSKTVSLETLSSGAAIGAVAYDVAADITVRGWFKV